MPATASDSGPIVPTADEDADLQATLAVRAQAIVARRALPGAFPYPALFLMTVLATGMAADHPATMSVLGAGLTAFTGLRVLRCLRESRAEDHRAMGPPSLLRGVILGQATTWTTFVGFTVASYGLSWPGMLVILCSAANITGGLFAFAPDFRLSRWYTAIMTLPLALVLVVEGSTPAAATAIFLCLYAMTMVWIARVQNEEFWAALESNELLERRTAALNDARRDAVRANRAKASFLANISHELRTPLHGILSYARFGTRRLDQATPDKLREYFARIESSGEALLALFDDLLDLSRLEARGMPCDLRPHALAPLLGGLADEFRGRCTEAGVILAVDAPEHLPRATLDKRRFAQVLRNLLGNACRFAPPGSTVRLAASPREEVVRVVVEDEGPGIPPEDLERIFREFVQSRAHDATGAGSGLGLSISRHIVDLHEGRLWAENRPEGGARFVVEIQASSLPTPDAAPAELVV